MHFPEQEKEFGEKRHLVRTSHVRSIGIAFAAWYFNDRLFFQLVPVLVQYVAEKADRFVSVVR